MAKSSRIRGDMFSHFAASTSPDKSRLKTEENESSPTQGALELLRQLVEEGGMVPIKSLIEASGLSVTAALSLVQELSDAGLIRLDSLNNEENAVVTDLGSKVVKYL
ncbi:MAG: winged helix-turn-helix transcriptional regulator [Candidatus Thiodiazotropha sp. (ex Lucinoma borealis)]|nr:winged helix-turn-helix transcriptional regulator [Candidatus Thiodiazotropha sp. (ex Lucinoma borealis)]